MKRKGQPAKLAGIMRVQCATCPFRPDGKGYTEVADLLSNRALSEATPICHSTGESNVTPKSKKVSRKNLACRGARDIQLVYFAAMGFIEAPTDEAWNKKCRAMRLPVLPTVTGDLLRDWEDANKQFLP